MSQTTYNWNPPNGRAGMVAEYTEGTLIKSKVADGAVQVGLLATVGTRGATGFPAAAASGQSTSPGQIKAFPVGGQASPLAQALVGGIPVYDSSRPPYDSSDRYADKDYVPVLFRGFVWVPASEAVTDGNDVYVWVNPGGGDPAAGTFAAGVNGGKAVLLPNARWAWTLTAPGVAKLYVDLPAY